MTHKVGHDIWVEGINKGKIKMPPLPGSYRGEKMPGRFKPKKSEGILERKKRKKAGEARKAERKLWGG